MHELTHVAVVELYLFHNSANEMESDNDYDQLDDEEIEALEMDIAQDGENLCPIYLIESRNTSILAVELCFKQLM